MLHVPVPIFWKDREGHLLGASRYWYGYFGLNPEGAAGEVNRMVPDDGTSGKEEEEILRTNRKDPGQCPLLGSLPQCFPQRYHDALADVPGRTDQRHHGIFFR